MHVCMCVWALWEHKICPNCVCSLSLWHWSSLLWTPLETPPGACRGRRISVSSSFCSVLVSVWGSLQPVICSAYQADFSSDTPGLPLPEQHVTEETYSIKISRLMSASSSLPICHSVTISVCVSVLKHQWHASRRMCYAFLLCARSICHIVYMLKFVLV